MSDNNDKIKYELFISHTDNTAKQAIDKIRYCRMTDKYCLFYPQEREKVNLPAKTTQISDDDLDLLPFEDKAWLAECNEAIITEYVEAHEKQAAKDFQQFQREYERELAAVRKVMAKGEVDAGKSN